MKPLHHYNMMIINSPIYEDCENKESLSEAYTELFQATELLDQAYKKVTSNECANEKHHILNEEQTKFCAILERYRVLFDGELGLYPHEKFRLKLKEGAISVHKKPYSVFHTRQDVFC